MFSPDAINNRNLMGYYRRYLTKSESGINPLDTGRDWKFSLTGGRLSIKSN